MDIKILVATHKKYWMPQDDVYLPIHVGKKGKEHLGYIGDDTGDNISVKNPNFCELTGLYWAWKNLDCEYTGLCHYRRYFTTKNIGRYFQKPHSIICTRAEVENLLADYDILLPYKLKFKNSDLKKQFVSCHNEADLAKTESIIKEKYPEYIQAYDMAMNEESGCFYNMFVMKKTFFDSYCQWLFDILFELEKTTDISKYDAYQARLYGFLSERLFNVWLKKYEKTLKYKYLPVVHLEENILKVTILGKCRVVKHYLKTVF